MGEQDPGHGFTSDTDPMGVSGFNRPSSSGTTSDEGEPYPAEHHEDGHDQAESTEQTFIGQQPNQQQYHRSQPQRYHADPRQAQRARAPAYRLQAKITGLERTGRKDPILRFDVHVCYFSLISPPSIL